MAMKKEAPVKPRLATIEDPLVNSAVGGFFKLQAKTDALAYLQKIATQCILAKDREPIVEGEPPVLKLWVRGFEVTGEEKAKGYCGNFARIRLEFTKAGHYTLIAEKLEVDVSRHPQKERANGPHPNWGHPVMREIEKGKTYPSIAVARERLERLHLDYPLATLPGKDTLNIMLYNRNAEGDSPIDKITVKIKPLEEGGAKIVQLKKAAKKKDVPTVVAKPVIVEGAGKFTDMLKKQRAKKKPKPGTK
jgi:hypothetical protein